MNRLTHERCSGIKAGYWTAAKKEELIQRLAAYENTGLEPEQIEAMRGHSVALMAELEEREFPWISVKDRLPEGDVRVLVILNSKRSDTEMDTDRMHAGEWVRWGNDVTHWMPLPEPPEEGSHA